MFQKLSSIAAVTLVVVLEMTAITSVSSNPERYYWFAGLVILLWGQPLSLGDPYRTDKPSLRTITYLGIVLVSIALGYIFARWQPYLIAAGAFGYGMLEMLIRRRITKEIKRSTTG